MCSQGSFSETVSISNLGVAKTGPVVEDSGSLLLEYVNGSACTTSDQRRTTYTTRIHLVCSIGSLVRGAGQRCDLAWSGSSICTERGFCLVLLLCVLQTRGGQGYSSGASAPALLQFTPRP